MLQCESLFFRSDDQFLLLLPCPCDRGIRRVTFSECWETLILLLHLCGNVEVNHSPQMQEYFLKEILAGQNDIKNEMSELRKQHLDLDRHLEHCRNMRTFHQV